jgi:hypothetical protein
VTISASGTFLIPGSFTATGNGGKDVGPIITALTISALPTLTSPASSTNLTLTRSSGLTVTWTPGGTGTVNIQVSSGPDAFPNARAQVSCKALASAGTFTNPPYVLLALPTTGGASFFIFGSESQAAFSATGIDFGNFHANIALAGFGGFAVR